MYMKYIKLIRLKNGEDLISYIEESENEIRLRYPLNANIIFNTKTETQELILSFWLPTNLVKDNSASIPRSEILLILDPNEEFAEYYLDFLNERNETKTSITNKKRKELEELLKGIENTISFKLH